MENFTCRQSPAPVRAGKEREQSPSGPFGGIDFGPQRLPFERLEGMGRRRAGLVSGQVMSH